MKIALLICGQIRGNVKKTFDNLNKHLVKENVDVFISSWKESLNDTSRGVDQRTKHPNLSNIQSGALKNYINNIVDISLYDNIDLVDQFNMHQSRYESKEKHSSHGILYNQFLVENAINKLKKYEVKKNISYDIIVKVRPDFMFRKAINYEIGEHIYLSKNKTNKFQASDKFFYGNRELFIYFINCLRTQIQKVLTTSMETDHPNMRQKPIGERFYRQVLDDYKISTKIVENGRILR